MLEALIGLLPALRDLLTDRSRRQRLQDERGQRAVEAILRAVNETELYAAGLSRGEARESAREDELSRRWTETAAALHGIDHDLAQRCRLKGDYWADPDPWTDLQLREAKILLTTVASDADALLGWSGLRTPSKTCRSCQAGTPFTGQRVCPACGHTFQGNGWDGIDAHWRAKHESVTSYGEFWASLCDRHRREPPR